MEWRALVQWRAPGNHCFLRLPSLGDKPSFCGLSPYIYRLSTLPWTSAALYSHLLCYFALCYIFSSTDTLPQLSSSSSCGRHWQVHILAASIAVAGLSHPAHCTTIISVCLLDKNILPQQVKKSIKGQEGHHLSKMLRAPCADKWILSNHKWFYFMMRNFLKTLIMSALTLVEAICLAKTGWYLRNFFAFCGRSDKTDF